MSSRSRWILKSLLSSSVGTAADYTILTVATFLLGARTLLAVGVASTSGATINFLLNRRYAFMQHRAPAGPQALRFAVVIGLLLVAHALSVTLLRDRLGVPLYAAKVGCDVVWLLGAQLVLLRLVVFPERSGTGGAPAPGS